MAGDRTLVTGGAGFIGSVLSRRLIESGAEVGVLDNLSMGRRDLLPPTGYHFVQCDVRDRAALKRAIADFKPSRVFHLAAIHYIPFCNAHPEDTTAVNVDGTRNLFDACGEGGVEGVFLASTAAIYPAEGSPFREAMAPGPIDIYGRTKASAEEAAGAFARETSVPTVVGRLFNAFGPNDTNPHLIPDVLGQVKGGTRVLELGNLDPVRDYIYVDDLVSGILAAFGKRKADLSVFNIGSGKGHSVRQVVSAFEAALGEPLEVKQAAGRLRKVERMELVSDIAKLSGETGWAPRVDFAAGIATLVGRRSEQTSRP